MTQEVEVAAQLQGTKYNVVLAGLKAFPRTALGQGEGGAGSVKLCEGGLWRETMDECRGTEVHKTEGEGAGEGGGGS